MEEFWGVLVVIIAVFSVISKAAKKGQTTAGKPNPAPAQTQPRPAAPAPPQPAVRQERPEIAQTQRKPMESTLRITPHDHRGMFDGSLQADEESPEGRDPHDHGFEEEAQMPSMTSDQAINASLTEESVEPARPAGLNLTPDSIRQAFVLQEILKRRTGRRA